MQKLSLRSRGKYETKPSGKSLWTRMNNKVRDFLASMCFSGPSFLGMLAFYIIPFLIVIYYSFTVGLTDHSFAGLKNYINVWQNGAFKIAVKKHVHVHGSVRAAGGGAVAWPGAAARGADPPQKASSAPSFKPHDGPHCVHHPHLAGAVPL